MRTSIRLSLAGLVLILLLGVGLWWYLFGPNAVPAEQLVPSNTVAFLSIPNAAKLTAGYETSQLKKLVDSPNLQPLIDTVIHWIGEKNRALILAFLPNLSGQSFIAITHLDPDNAAKIGFIAGMKPKPGMGDFDGFVEKVKAAYPDEIKQGTTGAGHVADIDYQWIQGPGGSDKICIAKVEGWIITSWGEAPLQDWIERLHKKSSTPSLALNPDYQKTLKRVGENAMALVYVDGHAMVELLQNQAAKTNQLSINNLVKKLGAMGAFAVGSRFENGEIEDRFSLLMPRAAQDEAGLPTSPCPFDTLKFTGPDTRFYMAASQNWPVYWKNIQEQVSQPTPSSPMIASWVTSLQTWAQSQGLDIQRNIVGALGPEFSVQAEWSAETSWPEAGFFVKVDKPDDFKPTIHAIVETVRAAYATTGVINEINAGGRNFATLKFVNPLPVTPTITEDGDYFGIFLTENQAVRAFQRDETVGLLHNADFLRQVGDKRNSATQIIFLDSPQLFDRAYRTAQPYLSLAAMFNKDMAAFLKNQNLPPDLAWLAPMGPWSFVVSPDDEGMKAYSVSGIGNQGILLAGAGGGAAGALQAFGRLTNQNPPAQPNPATPPAIPPATPAPNDQPPQPVAPTSVAPDASTTPAPPTSVTPDASTTPAPPTNSDVTPPAPTPTPATTQ